MSSEGVYRLNASIANKFYVYLYGAFLYTFGVS